MSAMISNRQDRMPRPPFPLWDATYLIIVVFARIPFPWFSLSFTQVLFHGTLTQAGNTMNTPWLEEKLGNHLSSFP